MIKDFCAAAVVAGVVAGASMWLYPAMPKPDIVAVSSQGRIAVVDKCEFRVIGSVTDGHEEWYGHLEDEVAFPETCF
jgi:hypothetical protein